jgi:hypothetical protein
MSHARQLGLPGEGCARAGSLPLMMREVCTSGPGSLGHAPAAGDECRAGPCILKRMALWEPPPIPCPREDTAPRGYSRQLPYAPARVVRGPGPSDRRCGPAPTLGRRRAFPLLPMKVLAAYATRCVHVLSGCLLQHVSSRLQSASCQRQSIEYCANPWSSRFPREGAAEGDRRGPALLLFPLQIVVHRKPVCPSRYVPGSPPGV